MVNIRFDLNSRWRNGLLAGFLCLGLATGTVRSEAAEHVVTEQTESFLGNRSSVGSLVGGILAGAAFANPFAPLGGTIIGFFVGKSTEASELKRAALESYSRQGFAPASSSLAPAGQLALSGGGEDVLVFGADATPANEITSVSLSENQGSVRPPPVPGELRAMEVANRGVEDAVPVSDPTLAPPLPLPPPPTPAFAPAPGAAQPQNVAREEPVHLVVTKDVGGTQAKLQELAETIRREQRQTLFVPSENCPADQAPRYRKKLAVAGFALEHPGQGVFGGLDQAGEAVSRMLYQNFLNAGKVLPYVAPKWQMFASLDSAPTRIDFTNRLGKYSAVSREMGAQFVVAGVIRNLAVNNEEAWSTSSYASVKRALFSADTSRAFVVDVVVFDGFSGRVVMEKRYQTSARWDVALTDRVGFGTPRFEQTGYGQAVTEMLAGIADDITTRLECQPMLVPIMEADGKNLVLDVGTGSGLLPGDKMHVVRAQSSWATPDAPPKLVNTGVQLHIHKLTLSSSTAWMPEHSGTLNIQAGDYAIVY